MLKRLALAAAMILGLSSSLVLTTEGPARATAPFECASGQLCLHLRDPIHGTYTWTRWTACGTWHHTVAGHPLAYYDVTWVVNNQTPGTRTMFRVQNDETQTWFFWLSPKPFFSGRGTWYGNPHQWAIAFKTC